MNGPRDFRKKPVVIQAMQFEGTLKSAGEIQGWAGADVVGPQQMIYEAIPRKLKIRTLEGDMFAARGDWVIRGVKGEFYPCRQDIFEETYEEVPG